MLPINPGDPSNPGKPGGPSFPGGPGKPKKNYFLYEVRVVNYPPYKLQICICYKKQIK